MRPAHMFSVDSGPGTEFLLELAAANLTHVEPGIKGHPPVIFWSANAGEQIEALLHEHYLRHQPK